MTAPVFFMVVVLFTPVQDAGHPVGTSAGDPTRSGAATPVSSPTMGPVDQLPEARMDTRQAFVLPGADQRPAALVAARVRDVLGNQSDENAWRELADVLPELALRGGADPQATFAAANIAGLMSLVDGGSTSATVGQPALMGGVPSRAQVIVLGAIALLLVGVSVRSFRGRRRGRRRSSPRRALIPVGMPPGRFNEARQLVAGGIPIPEIAQRTGMARDAVTIMMRIQGR